MLININLYIFKYKEITSDADDDLNEEPVIKKRRKRVSDYLNCSLSLVLSVLLSPHVLTAWFNINLSKFECSL